MAESKSRANSNKINAHSELSRSVLTLKSFRNFGRSERIDRSNTLQIDLFDNRRDRRSLPPLGAGAAMATEVETVFLKSAKDIAAWADVMEQMADGLPPCRKRTRLMTYSLQLRASARAMAWAESPELIPPRDQ